MELLILLGFLLGWVTGWVQQLQCLNQARETAKGLTKQLHYHLETVAAQEMQILRVQEKVLAQEQELDSLRYRI